LRDREHRIHVNVHSFLIYNYETGEIYARISSGEYRSAAAELSRIKSAVVSPKDREDAEESYKVGKRFLELGIYENAKSSYQTAASLVPNEPRYRAMVAIVCNQMNNFVEGEQSARIAVELDPNQGLYHQVLGVSLLGQNKLVEAESTFRTATRLLPDSATAHVFLGETLHRRGNLTEAESELIMANRLDPKNKDAKNLLKEVQGQIKKRKN